MSVFPSLCIYVMYFFIYFFLSFFLAVCLSFFLYFFISFFLSFFLSVCLSFFLSFFLSFCLSVFLSFCLSFFRSFFLSFFLFSGWQMIHLDLLTCIRVCGSVHRHSRAFAIGLVSMLHLPFLPWRTQRLQSRTCLLPKAPHSFHTWTQRDSPLVFSFSKQFGRQNTNPHQSFPEGQRGFMVTTHVEGSIYRTQILWELSLLFVQAMLLAVRWHLGDAHGSLLMLAVLAIGVPWAKLAGDWHVLNPARPISAPSALCLWAKELLRCSCLVASYIFPV